MSDFNASNYKRPALANYFLFRMSADQLNLFMALKTLVNEEGGEINARGERDSGLTHVNAVQDAYHRYQIELTKKKKRRDYIAEVGRELLDNKRAQLKKDSPHFKQKAFVGELERALGSEFEIVLEHVLYTVVVNPKFDMEKVNELLQEAIFIASGGRFSRGDGMSAEQMKLFLFIKKLVDTEAENPPKKGQEKNRDLRRSLPRLGKYLSADQVRDVGDRLLRIYKRDLPFSETNVGRLVEEGLYRASRGRVGTLVRRLSYYGASRREYQLKRRVINFMKIYDPL